jgi:hypothetical protein
VQQSLPSTFTLISSDLYNHGFLNTGRIWLFDLTLRFSRSLNFILHAFLRSHSFENSLARMQWTTSLLSFGTLLSAATAAPTWLIGPPLAAGNKPTAVQAESVQAASASYSSPSSSSSSASSPSYSTAPAPAMGSSASSSETGLATWMWNTTLISDKAEVADFFSFAKENNINTVYAGANGDIHHDDWQSFISQCSANGIKVDALIGNAQWVVGGGFPTLEMMFQWIDWHQGNCTDDSQKLSGIHFDIEPWALDDFQTNKATHLASWEKIVGTIISFAKEHGLTTAADLPFWANTVKMSDGQSLDAYALSVLDSVTFMTYRNTAAGVLSVATEPLKAGKAANKRVWLAVETRTASEESLISYVIKPLIDLTSDLKTILTSAKKHKVCAGVAVHDYQQWKSMHG